MKMNAEIMLRREKKTETVGNYSKKKNIVKLLIATFFVSSVYGTVYQ